MNYAFVMQILHTAQNVEGKAPNELFDKGAKLLQHVRYTTARDIFNDDNRYSLSFKKSKPFLSHMSFTIHSNNFDVIHIIEHISDELNIDDNDDISDEINIHDIDDR